MKIAIEYDAYTHDPKTWREAIAQLQTAGHEVVCVALGPVSPGFDANTFAGDVEIVMPGIDVDVRIGQPADMTTQEKVAMDHLVNFWNAYVALPDARGAEATRTIANAMHIIQGIMAIRVARRVNPEIWL